MRGKLLTAVLLWCGGCDGKVADGDSRLPADADVGDATSLDGAADASFLDAASVDRSKLGGPCGTGCYPGRGQCVDYSEVDPTLTERQCVAGPACWPVTCPPGQRCHELDFYVNCR